MSETPILTKKIGRNRNAVAVFRQADGSGYHLEYGMWSHATGRVLNREEEETARKCHYREAHPGATYGERGDFAAKIRPVAGTLDIGGGRLEGDGSGAEAAFARVMVAAVKKIAQNLDALVVVAEDVPEGVADALAAAMGDAMGAGRVYRPPAMGLKRRVR